MYVYKKRGVTYFFCLVKRFVFGHEQYMSNYVPKREDSVYEMLKLRQ